MVIFAEGFVAFVLISNFVSNIYTKVVKTKML
jgi:hypothetical protein